MMTTHYMLDGDQKRLVRDSIGRKRLADIYQVKPFAAKFQYRRAERVVVGYTFVKIGSHHLSGTVHQKIVAYGETLEAAIAALERSK